MGCICALCFICVPLSIEAKEEISISSFSGFDWADSYWDLDGNEVEFPGRVGTYEACDIDYNCEEFELVRDKVVVNVTNPTCYYDEIDGYVPMLDVSSEYPLLNVYVDSEGKFFLKGTTNYPDVEFVLKNESLEYKKKIIDLYHEDRVVPYSSEGIYLEGTLYKDVGEYIVSVKHNYNLDHYEVINETYKLRIIEDEKEETKDVVVPSSKKVIKDVSVPKESKGVKTGVSSNMALFGSMILFSGIGIVVLKDKLSE